MNTETRKVPDASTDPQGRLEALVGRILCWVGLHDWRYASNYRRGGRRAGTPKEISGARCQRCQERKWEPDDA